MQEHHRAVARKYPVLYAVVLSSITNTGVP